MCLAFVAKQISQGLSYFYQAPERLFFLSDRQCLGQIEWELGILYLSEAQQLKTNYKLI